MGGEYSIEEESSSESDQDVFEAESVSADKVSGRGDHCRTENIIESGRGR